MFYILDYHDKHNAEHIGENIGKGKRCAEHQPGKSRMLPAQQVDQMKVLRDLDQDGKDQYCAGSVKYRRIYKAFNETIKKDDHQEIATVRPDNGIVEIGADDKFDQQQQQSEQEIVFIKAGF
ncbi:MAG TPA: hypothetical protein VIM55_14245 [Mucilaginibacter sp.]